MPTSTLETFHLGFSLVDFSRLSLPLPKPLIKNHLGTCNCLIIINCLYNLFAFKSNQWFKIPNRRCSTHAKDQLKDHQGVGNDPEHDITDTRQFIFTDGTLIECQSFQNFQVRPRYFISDFFSYFFKERDLVLSWNLTAALKVEYLNFKNFQFLPKIFFFEFLKVGSYLILSMRHLIRP